MTQISQTRTSVLANTEPITDDILIQEWRLANLSIASLDLLCAGLPWSGWLKQIGKPYE